MSLRFVSIVLLWLRSYIISNIFQIPKSGDCPIQQIWNSELIWKSFILEERSLEKEL